jgi:hypothetical protein
MSGIAFKIGDEFLKLPEGQKLSISIENPLFTENTLAGAISLPFSMPNIAHNQKLLKISNTLMSFEDTEIVSGVALYLGGNYWRDGKLIVNSQSPQTINVTFVEFDRAEDWENTTLQDLDLPSYDVSEPLARRTRATDAGSGVNIRPTYPNDYSDFYVGMINRALGTHPEKDWVCAPVYNAEVQHVTNIEVEYSPVGGTGAEVKRIERNLMQNMFFNGSYCMLCTENIVPTALGGTNIPYNGYFNFWDNWASGHPTNYKVLTLPNAISPFLYLNYVLKKIQDKLGLTMPQNFFEQEEIRDLILYTNRANIIFYSGWADYLSANGRNNLFSLAYFLEKNIDLKQYVPKISFANFFKGLKNLYNLNILIDYPSKTLNIQPKNILVNNMKVIDLSDKASVYENLQYSSTSSNTAVKLITSIVYAKQDDGLLSSDEFSVKNYTYKGWVENMAALPTTGNSVNDMYVVAEVTEVGSFTITIPFPATLPNILYSSYKLMIWNSSNAWQELSVENYMQKPSDITIDGKAKTKNELNLAIDSAIERLNGLNPVADSSEELEAAGYFCPTVSVPIATQKAVPADACMPNNSGAYPNYDVDAYGVPSTTEVISSMKVLFYRGFVGRNTNQNFTFKVPYANRTNFLWDKNNTPDRFVDAYEHSLDIEGPKGLYEKYYKDWIGWTRNVRRIVTYSLRLQAGEINSDLFTNYIQIESKRFVLKKITINATPNTILPCKMEMYQIEPSK